MIAWSSFFDVAKQVSPSNGHRFYISLPKLWVWAMDQLELKNSGSVCWEAHQFMTKPHKKVGYDLMLGYPNTKTLHLFIVSHLNILPCFGVRYY